MNMKTASALGLALLMLICAPTAGGESAAGDAKGILEAGGVKGGLVVHVNCGDGKLTAGLLGDGRFLVHGLDSSAANVAAAREHIRSRGVYGRASVDLWKGGRLPYVDNLVNLLVVSGKGLVSDEEALRVLAPRGVALIAGRKVVKPRPADIDEWTHWLHDSGNNAVARDRRVGVARNLQWVASPLWSRNHNMLPSFSAMVSGGGRIFYIIDEGGISTKGLPDEWRLVARDAFNGVLLWKVPIAKWGWKIWSKDESGGRMRFQHPNEITRRLVAAGDVLYVTLGFEAPVTALEAATGKVLNTFEGTEKASEMLVHDGLLVLTRNAPGKTFGKDLLVVDPATGKTLWEKKGFKGVVPRGNELSRFSDTFVTAGADKVFFVNGDEVVALGLRSGKELWKVPRPEVKKVPPVGLIVYYNSSELCSLVYAEKRLFFGQIVPEKMNANTWQAKEMKLRAMDPASGKTLWEKECVTLAHFTPPDLFVSKGMVWALQSRGEFPKKKRSKINLELVGLDVASGEARKTFKVDAIQHPHHHRCYRDKATERYYMAGDEGIEYIDLESGKLSVNYWLRGACRYGVMPANGLLYVPAHSCGCHSNRMLNGFYALATRGGGAPKAKPEADRLTAGPAVGAELAAAESGADDWPTYRHDRARSGCTASRVPAELSKAWEKQLGGRLTPPVVAGGKVLLAAKDGNQVYSLDAAAGEVGWRFTADGPVDTPPTYSRGRVCFGTHGGSVYCLAGDGRLAWRFQAAPDDSRVVAFDRVESPWPVHGSVLVAGGKVCCAAGRSSNLDSGIYLHALDLASGKLLGSSHQQASTDRTVGSALPDVLVADDDYVYMRDQAFDAGTLGKPKDWRGRRHLLAADGGLLDGTWINAAYWQYGGFKAQLLVFDDDTAFGVQAVKKLEWKSYSHDVFTPGQEGYRVFSATAAAAGAGGGRKKGRAPRPLWDKKIPVRAQAMVLTGKHLFLAGAPDVAAREKPWAAFEGRDKGVLYVMSREDGSKLAEYQLPAAPVYDGMAAAGGRLYLALKNGSVICMGPKKP